MLACYNETGDSMNTFLETDFVISGIRLCCKVSDENGTSIHRNRASHGLVLFVEGGSRFDFLGGRTVMVEKGQVIYLPKFSNYDSTDAPGAVCIAINFDLVDGELTFIHQTDCTIWINYRVKCGTLTEHILFHTEAIILKIYPICFMQAEIFHVRKWQWHPQEL